jgi:MFS transporter, DHA1 family, multidrug resistance protein
MKFGEALGTGAYRAALASSFANGWATFGVRMATVPLFAVAALGAGPGSAGWALAVFAGGNAAALTVSGRLADDLGRKPMMLTGLLITGAATAAIGSTHELLWFLVASAVAGIGAGLLGPAQQAAVADVVGNERSSGRVLAVFQMTADSGAIIGPVCAGLLADRLGYGWAFGVTGGILVAAAAGWLLARETLRERAQAKP